jgi:hypothetical protein
MQLENTTCSLKNILDDISKGALAPADLQDDYSWTKNDVINFVHDILKGYPMGNVLVWEPKNVSDVCVAPTMGPMDFLPSPEQKRFLLDGVNRFTTLLWMRHGMCDAWRPSQHEKETWLDGTELMLDPKSGRVGFYDAVEARKQLLMPASVIIDDDQSYMRSWAKAKLAQGFSEADIDQAYKVQFEAASKFRESKLMLTTLNSVTAVEAKDAYISICRPKDELEAILKFNEMASIKTDDAPAPGR